MNKPVNNLLAILLLIGCVAYLYGVFYACYISWAANKPPESYVLPSFLANTLTSLAALFSTNLGAVLGISSSNPNSRLRKTEAWNPLKTWKNPSPPEFQVIVCYVYIISLFACSIVWAHRNFDTDVTQINTLIPEMTKSLLGVVVGVLALSLSNEKQGD